VCFGLPEGFLVFISLQELESKPVRFSVDVPPGEISYDEKVTQSSSLHAEGRAELLTASLGEIRIHGKLSVKMEAACDRCLEPASVDAAKDFDLVYVPADEAVTGGEKEVDEAGVEVGYYEGSGLQLNDVLREVVLLALPMQLVCQEACKGICPACGGNRNQRSCDCQAKTVDDRWSKLKSFRAEFSPSN
jgi:DUF177 domain-containing protein